MGVPRVEGGRLVRAQLREAAQAFLQQVVALHRPAVVLHDAGDGFAQGLPAHAALPLERLVEAGALGRHLLGVDLHRPVRGGVVGGVPAGVVAGGGGVARAVGGEEDVARGEEARRGWS